MDASYEPQDADREAARPRSAPAFCQPQPAPAAPARPVPTVRPKPRPAPPETVAVLPKLVTPQVAPAGRRFDSLSEPAVRKPFERSFDERSHEPVRSLWGDTPSEEESIDEEEAPAAHWVSLSRGVALVLGTLLAVELFREGGLHAAGPWWLDTRPMPVPAAAGLLGVNAAFLILFAVSGRLPGVLRGLGMFCIGLLMAVALKNTTIYYGLLQRGDLQSGPAVAFGLHVVASFGLVLLAMRTRCAATGVPGTLLVLVGATAAMLAFPIAQIACTGSIDARRPAAAAVVYGPRPFESDAATRIVDRIERGAELYTAGLVPVLVLTGAGNEQLIEMQQAAIERGVPATALEILDERDVPATITRLDERFPKANAREPDLLVVSDADHLPRITIEARRQEVRLSPVPASSTKPASPDLLFREVGELWRSYLRR